MPELDATLRRELTAKYGDLPELSPEKSRSTFTLLRYVRPTNYLLFKAGDKKLSAWSLIEYRFTQQFPLHFNRRRRFYNPIATTEPKQYYLSQVVVDFIRGNLFKEYEFEIENTADPSTDELWVPHKPRLSDYCIRRDLGNTIRVGYHPHETFGQAHLKDGGVSEVSLFPFESFDEIERHRAEMEKAKEENLPFVAVTNDSMVSFTMPTSQVIEIGLNSQKVTLLGNGLMRMGKIPQIDIGESYTSSETPPYVYRVLDHGSNLTFSRVAAKTGQGIILEVPKIPYGEVIQLVTDPRLRWEEIIDKFPVNMR